MTIDQVRQLVTERGIHARKLREVLSLLSEDWHPLAELVRLPAVPRRTVQDLLKALGDDAESSEDRYRIAPGAVASYRAEFGVPGVRDHTDVLRQILVDIADVPAPLSSLDHVQATAETALNRAVWLDSTYDLTGRRVPRADALARLAAGGLVLVAGDNRAPDEAYLKLFRGDLLVLVAPELVNVPTGKGLPAVGPALAVAPAIQLRVAPIQLVAPAAVKPGVLRRVNPAAVPAPAPAPPPREKVTG